jgi:amidase/aspartyl-tRNA(Asn)/glutamyl-tRNA(Gln) amidotransferase subunit A
MGLLTQPISCIGLPVCAVPVWPQPGDEPVVPALPVGVQVIAAPWREDQVLRVAAALQAGGVAQAPLSLM